MALLATPSQTERIVVSMDDLIHSLSKTEFVNSSRTCEDFRGQCYTYLISELSKLIDIPTPPNATPYEKWNTIKQIDSTSYSRLVEVLHGLGCYLEEYPKEATKIEKLILLAVDDLSEAELNYRDRDTHTILHLSTQLKTSVLFDALISSKGLEIEKVDSLGRSAAHWCCYTANFENLRKLIQRGAKVDIKDQLGKTVQELAGGTYSFQQAMEKTHSRNRFIAKQCDELKAVLNDELYHGKVSKEQLKEIMKGAPNGTYFFYSPNKVLARAFTKNQFVLCLKLPNTLKAKHVETSIKTNTRETPEERLERHKIGKIKNFDCKFDEKIQKISVNYPELKQKEFASLQEIVIAIRECKKPFHFYMNLTNK